MINFNCKHDLKRLIGNGMKRKGKKREKTIPSGEVKGGENARSVPGSPSKGVLRVLLLRCLPHFRMNLMILVLVGLVWRPGYLNKQGAMLYAGWPWAFIASNSIFPLRLGDVLGEQFSNSIHRPSRSLLTKAIFLKMVLDFLCSFTFLPFCSTILETPWPSIV